MGWTYALGERLNDNVLTWLIIHPNPFSISQKPGFLLLNICILTLWIAYWLFLLTTRTWTLNPIGNNYLSRAKEKKNNKICVFSFHYRSACSWKNMYLSSFQHLAGDASNAVVISEPGWQIHVSVVKTNQGFFSPSLFFNSFFFLPLWQSYITIWDLSATLMHYSVIKWHSHYRIDDGPVLTTLWIKQLPTTERLNGLRNSKIF